MREIIEEQSIIVRERSRRESTRPSYEVGADVVSGGAIAPERTSRSADTTLLRLPQQKRKRRRILERRESTIAANWQAAARRSRNVRPLRLEIDAYLIPALVAVPIALFIAALLWAPLQFVDRYAHRAGFAVPSFAPAEIPRGTEPAESSGQGQPLSGDPRDFQAIHRTEYTVVLGDTISEIADDFGLDTGTILSANPIDDVRRLLPGTVLSIPDRDGLFHVVQPGDSILSIAADYGVPMAPILDANDLGTDVLAVGETLFIPGAEMDPDEYLLAIGELFSWPVRSYRFTSGYGMRSDPFTGQWRMHTGIDLANAVGTPIYASRPGRVVHAENSATYGNLIIIDHFDGFRSLYAHLSTVSVQVGQRVTRDQMIGRMGNTGRSTGAHLHFAVFRNNRPEDPLKHLP
jgi:murein DD-endopeptidase MepM/ murein hydrolase activator NlpD